MQNIKALYHIYKAGDTGYKLCKDGSPACTGYGKESKTDMASSNQIVVPEAREALDRFKMEAASEVGVNLKQG